MLQANQVEEAHGCPRFEQDQQIHIAGRGKALAQNRTKGRRVRNA